MTQKTHAYLSISVNVQDAKNNLTHNGNDGANHPLDDNTSTQTISIEYNIHWLLLSILFHNFKNILQEIQLVMY